MLRIEQWSEGRTAVVKLEGRLAGAWADELGRILATLGTAPRVSLDLEGLSYADEAGAGVLRAAITRGAGVRSISGFVACLLELPPLSTEVGLVRAVLAGSEDAYLALATRCHPMMTRLARCLFREEGRAEQEALQAWGAVLAGLSGRGNAQPLDAWVLATASRSIRAASANGVPPTDRASDDMPGAARPLASALNRWTPGWLESSDGLAALRTAMDVLPPMERAVMILRDVAGLSPDSVDHALELDGGVQRALLHEARSKVHASLAARECAA